MKDEPLLTPGSELWPLTLVKADLNIPGTSWWNSLCGISFCWVRVGGREVSGKVLGLQTEVRLESWLLCPLQKLFFTTQQMTNWPQYSILLKYWVSTALHFFSYHFKEHTVCLCNSRHWKIYSWIWSVPMNIFLIFKNTFFMNTFSCKFLKTYSPYKYIHEKYIC